MSDRKKWLLGVSAGVLLVILVMALMMGLPEWEVYRQGKSGEAKLKEAESSRQIAVQEAQAKLDSAKMLAQAEVERARGVAQANKIVGESLKENNEYLLYLWIHTLSDQPHQTIYVPTEAGLPILEAGRFGKKK